MGTDSKQGTLNLWHAAQEGTLTLWHATESTPPQVSAVLN